MILSNNLMSLAEKCGRFSLIIESDLDLCLNSEHAILVASQKNLNL